MEGKKDDALTKKTLLDKERLRKRFFTDKTASKKIKIEPNEILSATQIPTTNQQETVGMIENNPTQDSNEELLERLAAQELLQEAVRGRARAEVGGPSGWKKRHMKPNLRFLSNSVLQTEAQNRRKSKQSKNEV